MVAGYRLKVAGYANVKRGVSDFLIIALDLGLRLSELQSPIGRT